MNRAERRRQGRADGKEAKLARWLLGLSFEQKQLLTEYCTLSSKQDLMQVMYAIEIVLRVKLSSYVGLNETDEIYKDVIKGLEEEGNKVSEFRANKEDYFMKIDGDKGNIISSYKELKGTGLKDKDIYEELYLKFSSYSKNAVKSVVLEHLRAESKKVNVEDKISEILDIKEEAEEKVEVKKEVKGIVFKELSKKVIADIEGSFGTYHIEDGVASNGEFLFKDKADIDKAISAKVSDLQSQIKSLQTQIKSLDGNKKELEEVVKQYL